MKQNLPLIGADVIQNDYNSDYNEVLKQNNAKDIVIAGSLLWKMQPVEYMVVIAETVPEDNAQNMIMNWIKSNSDKKCFIYGYLPVNDPKEMVLDQFKAGFDAEGQAEIFTTLFKKIGFFEKYVEMMTAVADSNPQIMAMYKSAIKDLSITEN